MTKLENFEQAFKSGCSGCTRECHCGKIFYNPDGGWDWEEGEIESLEKCGAISIGYAVGTVFIKNNEYVADCDCWHELASGVITWMEENKYSFVKYLQLERDRKQKAFEESINPAKDLIDYHGGDAWRAMIEAPEGQTVELLLDNGKMVQAHWAEDLSGEEQPPFSGWFVNSKEHSYLQIKSEPVSWRRVQW